MAKFNVLITRDTTESTLVDVEAVSAEEAEEKALAEARDNPQNFDWSLDDGCQGEIYIGDPGNAAELICGEDQEARIAERETKLKEKS